ncbi:MAG: alpha/beta fold hydrolase [Dehalococcoidia bacterium]
MPEVMINGYRMHYEVYGRGKPLVMIHGGLGGGEGCAQMVQHHAKTLSGRFQLVFYDRRAAGLSETPADGYSIGNYARDLHSLLSHLEIGQAHILGSSAGGPIALQFALDHPEMTKTLLLVNTMTYCQESERAVRQRELDQLQGSELVHGREMAVEKALESRWPGLRQSQPERFQSLLQVNIGQFDGLAKTIQSYLDIRDSLEDRLGELKMPTLVLHGDADSRIPVACGRQLHAGITGSQLHILPGAEHGLLTNEAKRSRNLIVHFLSNRAEAVPPVAD